MRKIIHISIPVVTLIVFVLIMLSGSYFKKQVIGTEQDFIAHIETIKSNVEKSQWEEAMKNTYILDDTWQEIIKKIQFSEERDQMNNIDINIARLKGAINANDKTNALLELAEAKMHWKNVGK